MIYRLLGELRIGPDDHPLNLPRGHNLVVLAALMINANRRLSKEELINAAWDGDGVAEAQLHKSMAALRALLGLIGRDGDLVTHARYGYELRVPDGAGPDDSDMDMLAFRRLVGLAEEARSRQQADEEIALLRRGLGLWHGQHPLASVPSDAFRQEIARLEQRRKRAAVRLFDLELTRRGYDRVLDELAELTGYYPGDGRLAEQLMIAQYRCGHAADATAAYERHAAALDDQTGGLPDPALRGLAYAIASGDESVVAAAEAAAAGRAGIPVPEAAGATAAVPRQLPPDPADFVGRDELIAEATWLLSRAPGRAAPVVVVTGTGGIGKTAMAWRVAHLAAEHYPDGQLYAELRATAGQAADTSEVLAQFLRAFGVPVVPEDRAERVAAYRTLLASRRVLVVLDDAADEAQVRDLIPANPRCGVLVTSRAWLPDLAGVHHVPSLRPLDRAAARELFLLVAGRSGIDLSAELDAVDRVVALCGGLPLALRIAGALRVHDHPQPTADLAGRLARQGPEAFTYGELSVARTIGAGFDRLGAGARQLFLEFGLLRLPSFALWTAAALGRGTSAQAGEALSELASRHMIELIEPQVRYRFHDLSREYAARRAQADHADADGHHEILARGYGALLSLVRRAHAGLYGGDFEVVHSAVPDWDAPPAVVAEIDRGPLEWFEKERLNIRAAVSHCADIGLIEICWDLAVSAHEFYTVGGYFDDWYATSATALRACQAAGCQRGEGVMLACLGQPALVASRREGVSGLAELQRAASLLEDAGDGHGRAIALRTLANALRRRGQLNRPLALFGEALEHYEASGDTVGRWQTLRYIGSTLLDVGRSQEALAILRAAEGVAAGSGKRRLVAQSRYWTGRALLATGDLDGAKAAFSAIIEAYAGSTGTPHAYALLGLADVAVRAGEPAVAEQYLPLVADLARDGADAGLEGRARLLAAGLRSGPGQEGDRVAALEQAVACFAEGGVVHLQARALAELARAWDDAGNGPAASAARARVEDLYQEMGLPEEDRVYREPPRPDGEASG